MTGLGEIVPDSDRILELLDARLGTRFFPDERARRLCSSASTELNALVEYYNWVDPAGYERSMRATVKKAVLWYLTCGLDCLSGALVDHATKGARENFQRKTAETLGLDNLDEPALRARLLALVCQAAAVQRRLPDAARRAALVGAAGAPALRGTPVRV